MIITDGQENASKEFSTSDVKKRIEHQQDVYKWEFLFLAANQDAFESGEVLGVKESNRVNFVQSKHGVLDMSITMSCCASEIRTRNRKKQ